MTSTKPKKTALQRRVEDVITQHGGVRAAAKALSVDGSYLSMLRHGKRTSIGSKLREKLGLHETVQYHE